MKFILAIGLGCVAIWTASTCNAAHDSAEPVFTNKTRFRIPFRYDAAEIQTLGAREIQLYVSSDAGRQWQFAGRAAPQEGKFDFEARGDGDYWFAVRTLDARHQLHPSGEFVPGLKVTVDTTQPSLQLTLQQTGDGDVELSWNIDDRNLDPDTLRLDYIQSGAIEWRQIRVTPQRSGRTAWSVPDGGFVAVRGSVRDLAANVVTAESQLRIVPVEEYRTRPLVPEVRQPVASNQFGPAVPPAPSNRREVEVAPLVPDPYAFVSERRQKRATIALPTTRSMPTIAPRSKGQFATDTNAANPEALRPRYPLPVTTPEEAPKAGQPRIVNTSRFQIGYKVEDVGPSGVSSVELFITQDDGRKWYRYGTDPDRISPFRVDLPRDGKYGFSLRVRSGVGLVSAPPQPNEKPAIVVVVDTKPPVVQLLPAQQGRGRELNKVLIHWKIDEEHPADKPVALYYSQSPRGPWEPINGWQVDTGSYFWTVGQHMPPRFYVRLAVRDAAGNIAEVDSDYPVIVDLTRPSARIVDVESLEAR